MLETFGLVMTVAVPFAGWVLSIQSKVTSQEVQLDGQKELLLSKLDDIDRRLGRIERALNGHLSNVDH